MSKQIKAPPRYYIGLIGGCVDFFRESPDDEDLHAELWRTRAAARRRYEDVQEVRLVPVPPKKRTKRR